MNVAFQRTIRHWDGIDGAALDKFIGMNNKHRQAGKMLVFFENVPLIICLNVKVLSIFPYLQIYPNFLTPDNWYVYLVWSYAKELYRTFICQRKHTSTYTNYFFINFFLRKGWSLYCLQYFVCWVSYTFSFHKNVIQY